jgi:hypothetical protein
MEISSCWILSGSIVIVRSKPRRNLLHGRQTASFDPLDKTQRAQYGHQGGHSYVLSGLQAIDHFSNFPRAIGQLAFGQAGFLALGFEQQSQLVSQSYIVSHDLNSIS